MAKVKNEQMVSNVVVESLEGLEPITLEKVQEDLKRELDEQRQAELEKAALKGTAKFTKPKFRAAYVEQFARTEVLGDKVLELTNRCQELQALAKDRLAERDQARIQITELEMQLRDADISLTTEKATAGLAQALQEPAGTYAGDLNRQGRVVCLQEAARDIRVKNADCKANGKPPMTKKEEKAITDGWIHHWHCSRWSPAAVRMVVGVPSPGQVNSANKRVAGTKSNGRVQVSAPVGKEHLRFDVRNMHHEVDNTVSMGGTQVGSNGDARVPASMSQRTYEILAHKMREAHKDGKLINFFNKAESGR